MSRNSVALVLVSLLVVASASAREVHLVQADGWGPQLGNTVIRWRTDVILYNAVNAEGEVRLISISNGQISSDPTCPRSFSIPPRTTAALWNTPLIPSCWKPSTLTTPLWVMKLQVSDGVLIENSLFIGRTILVSGSGHDHVAGFGRLSLPVFFELTPPNEPKVYVSADLGEVLNRINVGLFNASKSVEAVATIELRNGVHGFEDKLLQSRTVSMPPDTIVQVGGFQTGGSLPGSQVHIVVTIDQPSLSYVSVVANGTEPNVFASAR